MFTHHPNVHGVLRMLTIGHGPTPHPHPITHANTGAGVKRYWMLLEIGSHSQLVKGRSTMSSHQPYVHGVLSMSAQAQHYPHGGNR